MQKNYILIGMPGSGKTTLGKRLAQEMKMKFLDFDDDIIEKGEQQSVEELLRELWEKAFLELEENLALEIELKNTVLSTSGSLPLSSRAMLHLSQFGDIVYIKAPIEEIEARIDSMRIERIVGFPERTLEELLIERERFYDEIAEVIFEYEGNDMEQIYQDFKKTLWLTA